MIGMANNETAKAVETADFEKRILIVVNTYSSFEVVYREKSKVGFRLADPIETSTYPRRSCRSDQKGLGILRFE